MMKNTTILNYYFKKIVIAKIKILKIEKKTKKEFIIKVIMENPTSTPKTNEIQKPVETKDVIEIIKNYSWIP